MVTPRDRKIARMLVWAKAFYIYEHMRCGHVGARRGFGWILRGMKKRQVVDDLHHAPACPANHWHKMALVTQRCRCGAAHHAAKNKAA